MKYRLIRGDCLIKLKEMKKNSVDLIVTDPPYGYSFMGKDWDKAVPKIKIWKRCLKVLKPGGFAFIMCGPRQDCLSRMILNLSEAGFRIDFTSMYHAFATGFPKASNISKLVDKQQCKKQLTEKLGRKPTKKEFEEVWKNYRKIIGQKTRGSVEEAKSPQAKALSGSYSYNPKPAVEIIIICQKPMMEKTYVGQASLWYEERQNIIKEIEEKLKKQYNLKEIIWSKD